MPLTSEFLVEKLKILKSQYPHAGDFCFFTDVENLRSIFSRGSLLPRERAVAEGLIVVDGASPTILGRTPDWVKQYVRLYFAPRTPMLYQTEGIKRANNGWPECPCPVYLVFDPQVLTHAGVQISDGNMGSNYTHCLEATDTIFGGLPFEDIYHRGPLGLNPFRKWEIMRCRHAEILIPSELSLVHLSRLVFRSEAEKGRGLAIIGKDVGVPTAVDKSWFFADQMHRPYLEEIISTAGTALRIANLLSGDALVYVVGSEDGQGTFQRCTYTNGQWSGWTPLSQAEAVFATVREHFERFYLNGRKIAEVRVEPKSEGSKDGLTS